VFPIGASLAAAREARGLDLRDAERLTCMRSRYLEALEGDRFGELPGRAYARAFLRSYASALGLDANLFVAEFDEQLPEPEEPVEPAPRPNRRLGRAPLKAAPVAAVLALVALLAWSAWSNDHLGGGTAVTPPPPKGAVAAPVVHHVGQVKAARKTLRTTTLVVRAVGGPCWVQARRGGPNGVVLAVRTLAAGESLRIAARHVWLRLGAPWNVRVQRGTHVVATPAGTRPVNVVA
jgi:hypothetical protein